MRVVVNGKERDVEAGVTIGQIVGGYMANVIPEEVIHNVLP